MSDQRYDIEELIEKIVKEKIHLHKIDGFVDNENIAVLIRRKAIERITGVILPSIGSTIIDFVETRGNIENAIGAVQIPLGIAGPLRILGEYARGEYYIPLATTEGALVASINRGIKAVNLSGGVKTKILFDGMTRAPLFWVPDIETAIELVSWVNKHFMGLKKEAESTTRHGKLIEIQPFILGNNVWLRFVYETGDAMGMNMVTIATDKACRYIEENFPGKVRLVSVSGNMCSDKKPAMVNMFLGRGKTVVAEAIVKQDVVKEVLKTSPEAIIDVNTRRNYLGSVRAGSISFNAHYANIIAAIFIATGQDVAQIIESSMGYTWAELRDNNLYISVTLPSLEVGTVGGGTRLPTQYEALSILGVAGGGKPPGVNAKKFAEIVAATVLAGELNLLAALSTGELARAHIILGRPR